MKELVKLPQNPESDQPYDTFKLKMFGITECKIRAIFEHMRTLKAQFKLHIYTVWFAFSHQRSVDPEQKLNEKLGISSECPNMQNICPPLDEYRL